MKDVKTETSSLNFSASSKSMKSVMSAPRARSRSFDISVNDPVEAGWKKSRWLLEVVVKVEFGLFLVLALAVALLHFKVNRLGRDGELVCRVDL